MDPTKKRKLDENGAPDVEDPIFKLTAEDARRILEPFSQDQLLEILQNAAVSHPDVLEAVRSIADRDVTQRKLFIRGLGWETTSDSLRSVFASFGDLEEAVVILDKNTGKSKGYGFVTYKHIDGAVLALKDPSKKIDGRVAVAQLASAGISGGPNSNPSGPNADVSLRKIYVGNVPHDMPAERLLSLFSPYGEIEEGPLGFDKLTGKSKGFALFVYKTPDAAQASLMEPVKNIDGRQLVCKLASEGKKGKPGLPGQDGMGMQPGGPMPGPYGGPAAPGGYSSYGGFTGASGGMGQHPSNPMNSGSYSTSVAGQGPGGFGGNAGYGGGGGGGGGAYGGPGYGGAPNSTGYPGYGSAGGVGYGSAGSGFGGPVGGGGMGRGSGMYGMPPSSGGMPSGGGAAGGYSDGGGPYSGYSSQQHQPTGTSPAPRVPPGAAGGYPGFY